MKDGKVRKWTYSKNGKTMSKSREVRWRKMENKIEKHLYTQDRKIMYLDFTTTTSTHHTYGGIGETTQPLLWSNATAPYACPEWRYPTRRQTRTDKYEWSIISFKHSLYGSATLSRVTQTMIDYRHYNDRTRLCHACPKYLEWKSWLRRNNAPMSTMSREGRQKSTYMSSPLLEAITKFTRSALQLCHMTKTLQN